LPVPMMDIFTVFLLKRRRGSKPRRRWYVANS
jgi:hypothetical protein